MAISGIKTMNRYQGNRVFVDYLYVDHSRLNVCVKTRILDFEPRKVEDVPLSHASVWVAKHGERVTLENIHFLRERMLKPVALFTDPFRQGRHKMVLCDVMEDSSTPIVRSYRDKLVKAAKSREKLEILIGFEQEYYFYGDRIRTELYTDSSRVSYHDQVGIVKGVATQRQMAEEHVHACLVAGLNVYGYNREKARGQWEYQLGPSDPVTLADHTVIARYILKRVAELHDAEVTFHPFPEGQSFPSSLHLNFSTNEMRKEGGLGVIKDTLAAMSKLPQDTLLRHYDRNGGYDNAARLLDDKHLPGSQFKVGLGVKDSAIRIPTNVLNAGCGHFEDRRPSSDCDPYELIYVFIMNVSMEDGFEPK